MKINRISANKAATLEKRRIFSLKSDSETAASYHLAESYLDYHLRHQDCRWGFRRSTK
ncbi:hypothetical protein Hanom_Chr17g01559051 [Helianthus anomalus]